MSQTETNPLNNPTIRVKNPTQIMDILPTAQSTNFLMDDSVYLRMRENPITIEQLDWVKLAKKNKYLANLNWATSSTGTIYTQLITPSFVNTLIPVGLDINTFINYDSLLLSLKNANNPFYAGLLLVTFDNAPSSTYYGDIFGITLNARDMWQFSHIYISPKTDGESNILIPINYPFAYFKNPRTGLPPNDTQLALNNWLTNYGFGCLRVFVLSPLVTTSTILTQSVTISGQVLDLSTGGLNFV
jgi:hypothetical protein